MTRLSTDRFKFFGIVNLVKLSWILQKTQARLFAYFRHQTSTVQLRKVPIGKLPITKGIETNEYIGITNYKEISPYRRILEIKNAKLNPKTGVVWKNQGLVAESSIWGEASLKKYEPCPRMVLNLKHEATSLADNGYFHFLTEDLPRTLQVIEYYPNARVIISDKAAQYARDAISFFKNEFIVAQAPLKCEQLLISEKIIGGVMTENDLILLKNFQSKLLTHKKNPGKKLFIKRKTGKSIANDESRGLHFQEQVVEKLKIKGFEVCNPEELSFAAQIELFSSATVIAGFHGAGLANQIWMSQGSKVIEYSHERITKHFSHLAVVCKHNYQYISVGTI